MHLRDPEGYQNSFDVITDGNITSHFLFFVDISVLVQD